MLTAQGTAAHHQAGTRFLPVLEALETTLGDSATALQAALAALRTALDAPSNP